MELTNARVHALFETAPAAARSARLAALLRRLGRLLARAYGPSAQALSLYR